MEAFATVADVTALFRALSEDETTKATALLPVVSDTLRQEAKNRGKDLDDMLDSGEVIDSVLKQVVVDVVARTLLTSTTSEPMTNTTESALGYSFTGTFLNPGGGLFVKISELKRLGIIRQRAGGVNYYVFD